MKKQPPSRSLGEVASRLLEFYGEPSRALPQNALEFILYENVSYLVSDARQAAAFLRLKGEIGTTANEIAAASDSKLRAAVDAPATIRETKFKALRVIARTVIDDLHGNLDAALNKPVNEALVVLQLFPSIGLPGAERIMLLTGRAAILALDSNGLRVLNRLGYAAEQSDYNKTYRTTREAVANEIPQRIEDVQRLHLLLRVHGKQLCRRTTPKCGECPLLNICDYGKLDQPEWSQ